MAKTGKRFVPRAHAAASGSAYIERLRPPSMARSRVQVATAYSPGALFTFEGGRGICLSVPISQPKQLAPSRVNLIFDGIREHVQTWLNRARHAIHTDIDADLCVDQCFIRPGTSGEIQIDRVGEFEVSEPSVIGYEPYPLLFQCQGCGKLSESDSVEDLAKTGQPPCSCGADQWRQVDVVFAHWSGEVEPLSPQRNWWNPKEGRIDRLKGCSCGSSDFQLLNKAPVFSEWRFRCASCGETREVVQVSKLTASRLNPKRGQPDAWRDAIGLDVNMLPVSYRATSLHYVQAGRFIAIDGDASGSWMELFSPGRENDLLREVAQIHRFAMQEPSWSEIKDALVNAGRSQAWDELKARQDAVAAVKGLSNASHIVAELQSQLDKSLAELAKQGAVPGPSVDSPRLKQQLKRQTEWARKRNPFRLTVEHRSFRQEHIDAMRITKRTVDLRVPDRQLFQHADVPAALVEYQTVHDRLLRRMGVAELFLIRSLPVVEYTFGFTRVSPSPVYERAQGNGARLMPTRLCAFPRMFGGKRPVYAMEQKNEALYVRLSESTVQAWLAANGINTDPSAAALTLGASFLEDYEDFGEFLDAYKVRDGGMTPRGVANFTFALLHTMSHLFVHAVADLSGLDADGIGEQVYAADLAFVVYRKGMTPDLGNISGMWRNRHRQFLERVLAPRSLRCGSGSLCDLRGGACPACVMTPDIGCVAHNQLLSRAMLAGGRPPTWDSQPENRVKSFFEVCRAAAT
jgi:hypothetical protein